MSLRDCYFAAKKSFWLDLAFSIREFSDIIVSSFPKLVIFCSNKSIKVN